MSLKASYALGLTEQAAQLPCNSFKTWHCPEHCHEKCMHLALQCGVIVAVNVVVVVQ